jgi:hypothetical protein
MVFNILAIGKMIKNMEKENKWIKMKPLRTKFGEMELLYKNKKDITNKLYLNNQ